MTGLGYLLKFGPTILSILPMLVADYEEIHGKISAHSPDLAATIEKDLMALLFKATGMGIETPTPPATTADSSKPV